MGRLHAAPTTKSMIEDVAGRTLTSDDLALLLERFRAERAGARTAEDMIDEQVQVLLARIAALTDALGGTELNDASRIASRVLLSDLAFVAAQFRGRANTMRASLGKTLEDLHAAIAHVETSAGSLVPPPQPLRDDPADQQ